MARSTVLGPMAQKAIHAAVDALFDRAKTRLLGVATGKRLEISFNPLYSLSGLFLAAGRQEGVEPREEVLRSLQRIAGAYLDSSREKTKARVLQQVQSFMADAQNQGIKTDVKTVLGGQLADLWADVKVDIKRIVETETTTARNVGIFDAIGRIGALSGRNDPNVFFVTVRDQHRCKECTRLHMMPDEITPRVWKLSDVGSGYHKRGQSQPKVGGLHPHCLTGEQRIFTDKGMLTAQELFELGCDNTVVVDSRIKIRRVGNNQFGAELPGETWLCRHASGTTYRPATHVYDTGVQKCLRVTLDSGHRLEVSVGHEMWVDDNGSGLKKRADLLSVGDKIPLLSGPGLWGTDSFPALAELMGNLLGDGSLGKDTAIWNFFGDDIEYGTHLKQLASTISSDPKLKGPLTINSPDEKYRVPRARFNSSVLRRMFVQDFGLSKKPRRVPRRIWGATQETVAAFLRGLYAADGCSSREPSVQLSQNDYEFLLEIQQLLSNFGIIARIYKHDDQGGHKTVTYANGDVYDTLRKPTWSLRIGGWEQVAAFAEKIQMGVPEKQARLVAYLAATESVNRLGSWRTARVSKIESIGSKQTYCLTEPMSHTITVNGIVTGNCRCMLTHLLPGYGFDASGRVTYIAHGHDEYENQRGVQKHEDDGFEPLQKGLKQAQLKGILRSFGWVDKAGGGHDMLEHPGTGAKIPFQRAYTGDYDWQWVDQHLGEAGLLRTRQNKVVADPAHPLFAHYVKSGHAKPPEPQGPSMKTWQTPGAETHLPIETMEEGGVSDGRLHADAVTKLKSGQPIPHVEVMDLGGGTYGTLSNHHILRAARDTGMTHVPVKLVKKE